MKVQAVDLIFYTKDSNNVMHVYGVITMDNTSTYNVEDLKTNSIEDLYSKDYTYIEINSKKCKYNSVLKQFL